MGIYESIFKRTNYFILCPTEKEANNSRKKLTDDIANVDRMLAQTTSPDLYKQRLILQTKFNLLLTKHITNLLNKTHHKIYEHGEKIGRILAHQLHQKTVAQGISEIKEESITKCVNHSHQPGFP